jgi:hypothetical protein
MSHVPERIRGYCEEGGEIMSTKQIKIDDSVICNTEMKQAMGKVDVVKLTGLINQSSITKR